MAKHSVSLELGVVTVPKAHTTTGGSLYPTANGKKLGTFSFGSGGVYWKPGKTHYKNQLKLNWSQFASVLNSVLEGE